MTLKTSVGAAPRGRPSAFVGAALVAALLAGALVPHRAEAQRTLDDRAALADLGPSYAERFTLKRGWFRGQPIQYFDIGPQENTTAAVFLMITGFGADGSPSLVPGQEPVFSSIPGLAGFSAMWQVQYVVVGPDYVADRVRDGREALAVALSLGSRLIIPGTFINYSIVPEGSSLENDPDSRPLLHGWYKGAEVPYFDFGLTEREPAPIYPFVTGFENGAPQFLRAQANIVDAVPGSDDGTHDLWDVMFVAAPAGYVPDSIRDLATLTARGLPIRRAGQVRNCPVVLIDGRRAPRSSLSAS